MNGLEAIQDRILSEAREKADRIIEQAQAQCAEIMAAAQAQKDQILAAARENTSRQAEAVVLRASSAAALESRRTLLQARQDQLDRVLERALEILSQLPADEKLAFYRDLITLTGATSGEIALAADDAKLGAALLADRAGSFTLAPQPGNFRGGLILRRGPIEDNLTFERLIAINRPQLVKLADEVLTAESEPVQEEP